jgi:plasmid maintenance system antidote protein VapI
MPVQYDQSEMLRLLQQFAKRCTTQQEAASKLGITPMYMSNLLRGKSPITGTIADKLGYTQKEVFEKMDGE